MAAINGTDGNDTLTGGDANDIISGLAGNDTLRGGDGADSLYGGDGQDDWLFGDSGNDYLQDSYGLMSGGAGNDTLDGTADGLNDSFVDADYGQETGTAGITVNLSIGRATDTYGDIDTLINIKGIIASSRADYLTGGTSDELFRGMAGNDTIDGGAGWDEVHYRLDAGAGGTAGVTVNLLTGLAVDGFGNTDQLISIERVRGSGFADLITGNADDNRFRGLGGNDSMAGGAGWDTLDYSVDARYGGATGVTVNLATGLATDGSGDTDSFTSMEAVKGTNFNDTLFGDDLPNRLDGQGGNDTLNGGGGNDTLQGGSGDDWHNGSSGSDTVDGGPGYDRANYRNLGVAVTIDMTAGTVFKAGGGTDTLISIERVMGSELADSIVGSAADDDFSGNQGNDTLDGGTGGDNVWYGNATSAVVVDLQAGSAAGGEGSDMLISIEYVEGSGYADTLLGSSADNYFRGDGATTDTNGGADYIDGRAGFDVVDYRDDPQRVTVSLASGLATDGRGYTDTLTSIEEARGSEYNDVLTGSTNLYFERFEGRGGDDTLDGGAITDTLNQDNANQASYVNAIGSVTVNLAIGSASGAAGNDVLLNFNQVRGSGFDDVLIGSNRTDVTEHFEGGLGTDTVDGAGGFDVLRFDRSTSAVVASLVSGTATGAGIGSDNFSNIEGLFGSSYNDVLTGGLAANGVTVGDGLSEVFKGGAGNDTIDGGQGYDRADYTSALLGVNVQLNDTLDGSASDGQGGTDVLRSIEGVRGSDFNDTLTGSDTAAYESFEGRAGADTIDGRGGVDRADYQQARAAVAVNLALQVASNDGYGSSDTLLNIENVRGSRDFNDTILGSSASNRLEGLGGDDSLTGSSGYDTIEGGDGNDTAKFTLSMSGNAAVSIAWDLAQSAFMITQGGVTLAKISAGATNGSWAVQDISNATITGFGLDVLSGIETLVFDSVDGATPVLTVATSDLSAQMASAAGMLINGTPNADNLTGGTGNDTIFGLAGNDTITATAGLDSIDGGTGTDTLVLDYSADLVAVTDLVIPSQVVDLSDTPQPVNLRGRFGLQTVGGIDNLLVTLTPYDDRATTSSLNDTVSGGSGNDWIDSAGGNDILSGNDGNDWLYGSNGVDSVSGGAGNDTLGGGEGNDTLDGGSGYDWARFGTNDGQALGSALNLNVSGSAWTQSAFTVTDANGQIDTLIGIEAVLIEGSDYADSLRLSPGNDLVYANAGNDSVEAGVGNDFLSGGPGNDLLLGQSGNDTLRGGAGDDTLNGGEQRNLAWKSGRTFATTDYDTADYTDVATGGIRVDLSTMVITGINGADMGRDSLIGIESVRGTRQADSVDGTLSTLSSSNEAAGAQHGVELVMYGGSDTVVQSVQQNTPWVDSAYLAYWWSDTAVNAVFTGSTGTISYGAAGTYQLAGSDTVARVSSIGDTRYSDRFDFSGMTGNHVVGARWNYVQLSSGNDTVIGNADTQVSLQTGTLTSSTSKGVNVHFAPAGTTFTIDMSHLASNGVQLGVATVSNIEAIRGTELADTLVGGTYDDFEGFRGRGGDDFIDGGSGYDRSDYFGATGAVMVNMAAGTATGDSSTGTDTLRSIERIRGTQYDDVYDARGFSGSSLNAGSNGDFNVFEGRGGNDTIYGNGYTRIEFSDSAVAVEVNLATGKSWALNPAERTGDLGLVVGEDTFSGVYRVRGSALGDLLLGGSVGHSSGETIYEEFEPGAGNDTVNGFGGWDQIYYASASSAIAVDLRVTTGQVQDGDGGVDTLIGIEAIGGTEFSDVFFGSDTNNSGSGNQESFGGGKGSDTINGGGGYDEVWYNYMNPGAGAVVNLATGIAQDGFGTIDTLISIEGVEGSDWADSITGSSADNRLDGRGGNDTLDGGAGSDWAEYNNESGAVQVNLALGTATGAAGNDTLISIENVYGTVYADTLTGDAGNNQITGIAGNDALIGAAGDDSLTGGAGNDTLSGGDGFDKAYFAGNKSGYTVTTTANGVTVVDLSGAEGTDTLTGIEQLVFADGTTSVGGGTKPTLSGIAYDWKNHMLLQDVAVSVKGGGAPAEGANAPIQFKALSWDASGHASVEVWTRSTSPAESLGFDLNISNASGITFTAGTLPNTSTGGTGWTLITNTLGTNLNVGGFANDSSAAVAAGDFKLGTITFETATAQRADLQLLSGDVGSSTATAYGLSLARTSSSASGAFSMSAMEPGSYEMTASRATTDIGNAITSADALSALKIAVGLNPNPDPDGTGPMSAVVVSPYQFMAADVVGTDGRITSADALAILKMAVKLPTAPAKEWMFVEETRDFWNETAGQFTLDRNHTTWDHSISTTMQAGTTTGTVNLVGVLKGDVNGSWAAPAGSTDLDAIDPTHFTTLSSIFGMPVGQFGVV